MVYSKYLLLTGIVILLVVSALAVVVNKYQSRTLFIEIQKQEKMLDEYEVKWGQLQLELSTLTEEGKIERIAKNKLKLILPQRENTIYIKP